MTEISIFKPFNNGNSELHITRFKTITRKLSQHWDTYKWVYIICAWLGTLILGLIGYVKYYKILNQSIEPTRVAYEVLRLFVVEGDVPGHIPIELDIARFLAPVLIALAGLQALTILFAEQIAFVRLKFTKNHIVICGLGENGLELVDEFYTRGKTVVAIESNPHHPALDSLKVRVIIGDATEQSILKKVRAHIADSVFTTTGDDGLNVEIAVEMYKLANSYPKKDQKRVICYVNVIDLQLRKLLNQHSISTDKEDQFELRFFNTFEISAKLLLRYETILLMIREDYKLFAQKKNYSVYNFVIIGFGRMGQSILTEVIKTFEYIGKEKPSFTILDIEAETRLGHYEQQHPFINHLCKISTYQVDVKSKGFIELPIWKKYQNIKLY